MAMTLAELGRVCQVVAQFERVIVPTYPLVGRRDLYYGVNKAGRATAGHSAHRSTLLEEKVTIFDAVLVLATFLGSLVAGLLFAFVVVVMPGIRSLDDGSFIRAFQAIDRVIQNNQPLFVFVWVGSVLALVAAAVLGMRTLSGADRLLIIVAVLLYLLCVQLPTATINIPLNNEIQKLDPDTMNETTRKRAREAFEPRWNRWNAFRTVCASIVSLVLMLLLLRV